MNRPGRVDIRIERVDDWLALMTRRVAGPLLMIWGTVGVFLLVRRADPSAAGFDVTRTTLLILKNVAITLAGWLALRARNYRMFFVLLLAADAILRRLPRADP